MTRILFIISIILFFSKTVIAQDYLIGIDNNPMVAKESKNNTIYFRNAEPLHLPFFDDFSNKSVFPDNALWTNKSVFINNEYGVNLLTVGVATFDAIDKNGKAYKVDNYLGFSADTLTSQPIRLDSIFEPNIKKLTLSDSVYLSFYIQPQGVTYSVYSGAISKRDSIILEFLQNDGKTWQVVWGHKSMSLSEFEKKYEKKFKQFLIPIKNETYLHKAFQFRFRNFATYNNHVPSMQNQTFIWNLDVVYLNFNRNINDTSYADVAFASNAPCMLKNYTSMPYNQYRKKYASEMKDTLSIKIANIGNTDYNISYRYEVLSENNQIIGSYNGGHYFIEPFSTNGYIGISEFATPPVNFFFPISGSDKATFITKHIISPESILKYKRNDTIVTKTEFSNYLAYDDGSSESGYGFVNNCELAYKFKLNLADTIYGLKIYFNSTRNNTNNKPFTIRIWNESFGDPNNIIYEQTNVKPIFADSLNKYCYYPFNELIEISNSNFPNLTFYVGIVQSSDEYLNLGFDLSRNSEKKIRCPGETSWLISTSKGSPMIRPIFETIDPDGFDIKKTNSNIIFYPNPIENNKLSIVLPQEINPNNLLINIFDSKGSLIISKAFEKETNMSSFNAGIYFIRIINYDGILIGSSKIIKK